MSQARQAWAAFKNMLRHAAHDPLWAVVAILLSPIRLALAAFKPAIFLVVLTLILLGLLAFVADENPYIIAIGTIAIIAIVLTLVFRFATIPLIEHFGDGEGDTHGSARFATDKETAALARADSGLLIGRDGKTGKLLRYDGPAHLLTMAPTRTGKGVGTIIPNLLTADRSVICIDPKGENAKIAGRARQTFGPVHVLDPFGVTGQPSAAFNPLEGLDPAGLDVAEDASTLADALVFDEPGMAGEAHWNEEAKALIAGLILHIAASEPRDRRNLATLREYLTLAPETFAALLKDMQASMAASGLIARAANRHLGKSDREAAGVLSAAQRHTHFLDSPRIVDSTSASDFPVRGPEGATRHRIPVPAARSARHLCALAAAAGRPGRRSSSRRLLFVTGISLQGSANHVSILLLK